jgi:hypothetical protein
MTTPQQAPQGQVIQGGMIDADGMPPLFDPGNPLLATGVPAILITGKIPTPSGEMGIVTIRTTTATLTVTADRKGVSDWADLLASLRDQMSESGLATVGRPSKLAIGRR